MEINIGQGIINTLIFMLPTGILGWAISLWRWRAFTDKHMEIEVIPAAGHKVKKHYIKIDGDTIDIPNPSMGVTRTWPVTKLNTVRVPYPGVGFLPGWMLAEIDRVTVNEGDWEPVTNRSPHRTKIMSPDAVEFLRNIAKYIQKNMPDDTVAVNSIDKYLQDVATGPTRTLVADPAWIGNLRTSAVLKALASVSDDLLEALKGIRNQLARFAGLNATYVYIGLALNLILTGVCVYFVVQSGSLDVAEMAAKVDALAKYFNVGG